MFETLMLVIFGGTSSASGSSSGNTQAQRMASIHVEMPWRSILPVPDGTISANDRAMVARMYVTLSAAAFVPVYHFMGY